MIAEIIPASRLKRNLHFFDYKIPDNLNIKIGDIVLVNLRNKEIPAIIYKIKENSTYSQLKTIKAKLEGINYNAKELELLKKLSKKLFISMANLVHDNLILKAQKKHNIQKTIFEIYNFNIQDKEKIDLNLALSKKSLRYNKQFFLLLNNQEKYSFAFYIQYFYEIIKNQKQVLILFPNLKFIEHFLKYIPADLINSISIISNKLYQQKNLFFTEIQKIKEKKINIIIATRSALFLNIINDLDSIIIDNAEHNDYKQEDLNPRYHTVDIAYLISSHFNKKLILSSLSPRLLDYYLSQKKENYLLINNYQKFHNTSYWINLKNNILDENQHPLIDAKTEKKLINNYINKNESTLILHNRKGYSQYIQCQNCQHILKCDKCQNYLQYNADKKIFYCPYCNIESKITNCPKCKLSKFKNKIYGIEQIYNYFKYKYPNINFIKIDKKTSNNEINLSKKSIIIATNYIFSLIDIKYFNNILLTNIEQILNINDFNSHWKSFAYLNRLIQLSAEYKINLYLESFNPDFFVFKYLRNNKLYQFYKEELKWRKKYNYPPYQQLIKIIYKDKDKKHAKNILNNTYKQLKTLEKKYSNINIYPAYEIISNNKKYFKWLLIIKTAYKYLQEDKELYNFLANLNDNFLIDLNPENLYK